MLPGTVGEDISAEPGTIETEMPMLRRLELIRCNKGEAGCFFGFRSRQICTLRQSLTPPHMSGGGISGIFNRIY